MRNTLGEYNLFDAFPLAVPGSKHLADGVHVVHGALSADGKDAVRNIPLQILAAPPRLGTNCMDTKETAV